MASDDAGRFESPGATEAATVAGAKGNRQAAAAAAANRRREEKLAARMAEAPPSSCVSVCVDGEECTELGMKPFAAGESTDVGLCCFVRLRNQGEREVIYQWVTSNDSRYVVRSARGVLAPKGEATLVEIRTKDTFASVAESKAAVARDKFRVNFAWGADTARWNELQKLPKQVAKRKLAVVVVDCDEELEEPVPEDAPPHGGADPAAAGAGEAQPEPEMELDIADDPAAWVKAENVGFCVTTIRAGDGCTFPQKGDRVLVHYTGMLRKGGTKFGSSRSKGEPFEGLVGQRMIEGWGDGLREMAQGERAVLRIAADKAYQDKGFPACNVPPNADLVFDIELLAVLPRPTGPKVKAYDDETRFSIITRFYEKHDGAKTAEQIRDILAKDKYKNDFWKLCKMLQKKYDECPAELRWKEQKLSPAQPTARAAPEKDPKAAEVFPGASAKVCFSAESKAPAFGSWSSQASTASSGGLFGKSSSTPAFSFTPSAASSASASVGKPAFGAPSVLGSAKPAIGSVSSTSAATGSVPAFSFAKIGQGSDAPSFSFTSAPANSAASSAASSSSFSFKPAPVLGSATSSTSTPPPTAPGVSAFPGAASLGTKLNFSTPGSVASSAGESPVVGSSPAQDSSDTISIEDMSIAQVADWVAGVKLEAEGDPFAGHHVDGVVLRHLDDNALKEDMSVTRLADRQAILSGIAILESAGYDSSLPPPTHLQGLFSTATVDSTVGTAAGTASTGFSFSSSSSGFSFSSTAGVSTGSAKTTSNAPPFSSAPTSEQSTTEDWYSYSTQAGHVRLGDSDLKLDSMSTKQLVAFYKHVCKAGPLADCAVSLLASHHVDGETLVHLTTQTCIEEMDATQALADFMMAVRDRLVNGPPAQSMGGTDNYAAKAPEMRPNASPTAPPVQPIAQAAFADGETISAMPSSVSGGHCFVSSGGAGILVAHTVGHSGDESSCMRGFANAQINVAQNGAGSATFAFEPGALAVDRRPPVRRNTPAAVNTISRAGGEEMTADARLRELEYNDVMQQNAELKAKVEELGGDTTSRDRSKKDGDKTEASKTAAHNRSTISCLACGDFRNPNFEIKGAEVDAREQLTCRSSAAVTEGRWYYEVQLLDSAASAKIGFAREGFAPRDRNGVGDDSSSWGFDGANLRKWHGGRPAAYGAGIMGNGKKWAAGDVVGCMLDLTSGTMSFTLNGRDVGMAFEDVPRSGTYFPAATLPPGKYSFRFGSEVKHKPPAWAGAFQLFDAPEEQISGLDDVPLPGLGGAPSMHGGASAGPARAGGPDDIAAPAAGLVVGASASPGRPGFGAVSGGDIFLAADGSGVVTLHLHLGAGALSLAGRCRACLVLGPGSGVATFTFEASGPFVLGEG